MSRSQVATFNPQRYRPRANQKSASEVKEFLDTLVTTPGRHDICRTCLNDVRKLKTPTLAAKNGFSYPTRSVGLPELTEVEEHILAPRIPFRQITNLGRMGRRGQYGLRGSISNIPTEPGQTPKQTQTLPLMPGDDEVYVVNLKRKLVHKRPMQLTTQAGLCASGRTSCGTLSCTSSKE